MGRIVGITESNRGAFAGFFGCDIIEEQKKAPPAISWQVYGFMEENLPVGVICAIITPENPCRLVITIFRFAIKEENSLAIPAALLEHLLGQVDCEKISEIQHGYTFAANGDVTDTIFNRLFSLYSPAYTVAFQNLYRRFILPTKNISRLQAYHWYADYAIPDEYAFSLWDKYPENQKNKIRDREQFITDDKYLSPFASLPHEPKTSYVFHERKSGNPVGWVITKKISDELLLVREWYIYKEYTQTNLGVILGAFFLHTIIGVYEKINFMVYANNRSMNFITDRFLAPLCEQAFTRKVVTISRGIS